MLFALVAFLQISLAFLGPLLADINTGALGAIFGLTLNSLLNPLHKPVLLPACIL